MSLPEVRRAFGHRHLSLPALALQAAPGKDCTLSFKALIDGGVIHTYNNYEPARSRREGSLPSLRLNPVIYEAIMSQRGGPHVSSEEMRVLAQNIVAAYAKRLGGKLLRFVMDGFFHPYFVAAMRIAGKEKVDELIKPRSEYDATTAVSISPALSLLLECIAARGPEKTAYAYRRGDPKVPISVSVDPPSEVLDALQSNVRTLLSQPNELLQLFFNALRNSEQSLKDRCFPRSVSLWPSAKYSFWQSMINSEKTLGVFAPNCLATPVKLEKDFLKAVPSGSYMTSIGFGDQGRCVVGFSSGAVGTLDLSPTEDQPILPVNVLAIGKHDGAVDISMPREGFPGQWVTACRAAHQIHVWSEDMSSFEAVPQLTRPPKKPSSGDDEEDEEDEEDEDAVARGDKDVPKMHRKLHVLLTARDLSRDQILLYKRSSTDDPQSLPAIDPDRAREESWKEKRQVALISVGGFEAQRLKGHDTLAPEHQRFNRIRASCVDQMAGVATISLPGPSISYTCGAAGATSNGDARIVLATDDGDVCIYKLLAIPPSFGGAH